MIQFQESNQTDRKTDRKTKGQLDPILQDLAGHYRGSASTTAIDWHLKVKDREQDVGLTKNYCITISMQKISSIHKLIFKIEQGFYYHAKIWEKLMIRFPENTWTDGRTGRWADPISQDPSGNPTGPT